jgi:hypothetical protein
MHGSSGHGGRLMHTQQGRMPVGSEAITPAEYTSHRNALLPCMRAATRTRLHCCT